MAARSKDIRPLRRAIFLLVPMAVCAAAAFAQMQPTGLEPLYPIFEDGRWGLIDPSGKTVLPPRFDQVARWPDNWNPAGYPSPVGAAMAIEGARPVRDSVIPVRLNGQAALATRDGQFLALGRYEAIPGTFSEGRIRVRVGGRYGFADERGEFVIPAEFDRVEQFDAGFAFVQVGDRWGIIDRDGRTVVSPGWDEVDHLPGDQWAKVRIGSLWGVIDRSGNVVIPAKFEEIVRGAVPPLIPAIDSGQFMYLRPDGTVAFQLKCPKGRAQGYSFLEKNSAIVRCGERYGLIDTLGNFLLEPTWDNIDHFHDGRAIVKSGRKKGVIDNRGQFILQPGKFDLTSYQEGMALFSGPDDKVGFIDTDGRITIPPSFEWADDFEEGLAVARSGGKAGYIDRTGSWVIKPQFLSAYPFHGPLATVEKPVGRDAKEIAYIDRSGSIVYRMRFSGFTYDDRVWRRFE